MKEITAQQPHFFVGWISVGTDISPCGVGAADAATEACCMESIALVCIGLCTLTDCWAVLEAMDWYRDIVGYAIEP